MPEREFLSLVRVRASFERREYYGSDVFIPARARRLPGGASEHRDGTITVPDTYTTTVWPRHYPATWECRSQVRLFVRRGSVGTAPQRNGASWSAGGSCTLARCAVGWVSLWYQPASPDYLFHEKLGLV